MEICEYDYTCPHCGKTWNVSSSNQAPSVGDIEICDSCHKGGRIKYAKVVYEVEKINR
jgi:transcription elongation factor Elf1